MRGVRVLVPLLGLVVGTAREVRADDGGARERFVRDGDAAALAARLGASRDPADRAEAALAALAADPAARLGEAQAAGAPVAVVVDALRAVDLPAARRAAGEASYAAAIAAPAWRVAGTWLSALVLARGGRDEDAARKVLEVGGPASLAGTFPIALLGAALPRDDREILSGILRLALVRAAGAGSLEAVAAVAEGAVALDAAAGARTLVVAARALRRGGRPQDAHTLLSSPAAGRAAAARPSVRIERAITAWRRGLPEAARLEAGSVAAPAEWVWAHEALSKAQAMSPVLPAPPLLLFAREADPDASALARLASTLGVAARAEDVAARAAAQGTTAADPRFVRGWLDGLGFSFVESAGEPLVVAQAAAKGLPCLLWRPRRDADRFLDHPVLVRGHDLATDLLVVDEPDPSALDVVPLEVVRKGRVLVAAPHARAGELAPWRQRPSGRLGALLADASAALLSPAPDRAAQLLEARASEFPGLPAFDLYLGYLTYLPALAHKDSARLAEAGNLLRRSGLAPPLTTLECFVRAEGALGTGAADAAAEELLTAARLEGAAAWIHTTRFVVLESVRRHAEALEALSAAREADPLDVKTLYFRGGVRRLLGDAPGARADFVRVLDRRPDYVAAAEDLVNMLLDAGDLVRAHAVVRALAEADPVAAATRRVHQLRQRVEVRLVRRARVAADLLALAVSPEPDTRREVAWMASSLETPEAERLLRTFLLDAEEAVRRRAAQAYQRPWLVDRALADAELLGMLSTRLAADPAPTVREALVQALARVEAPAAEAALLVRLAGPARDENAGVRSAVAEALLGREAPAVRAPLVDALEDPEAVVRTAALRALERLAGASNGFDPDGDPTRRAAAVRAWRAWLAAAPR